eukprot:15341355-Ditylum_brightwellii.AAC.1
MRENHDDMAWKQQYRILKSKQVENPNPKKQWCIDLEEKVKKSKKYGPVLLLCDANSDLMDQDLGSFLSSTGLYNLGTMKCRLDSPETYILGQTTLDYVFITIDLRSYTRI